jgi:hypothetical protein
LVCVDRLRVARHYVGKLRRLWITPLREHAKECVPLSKNADQACAFDHHGGAGLVLVHQPGSFGDRGFGG